MEGGGEGERENGDKLRDNEPRSAAPPELPMCDCSFKFDLQNIQTQHKMLGSDDDLRCSRCRCRARILASAGV